MPAKKACSHCGRKLPLSSFYPRRINRVRNKTYAGGVQSKCKICDNHDRTLRHALKLAGTTP